MIPNRIRVSESATSKLRYLKSRTGLTPNILARFAFTLSVRESQSLAVSESIPDGQEFNAPTLFGEQQRLYELLLIRYANATGDERSAGLVIANHIDVGLHKMGHIRSLADISSLR